MNHQIRSDKGAEIEVLDRSRVVELKGLDAVWVDAPCSGSGVLRRHPEIRWIKEEKMLISLQKEQAELLREAAMKVRPGGLLMFSVCSVLKKDELDQAIKTADLREFQRVQDWCLAPHLPPFGDGFSAVLFRRN
ncbi:MAG: hypothetical protein KGQ59_11790 [Bdellovibrionales bacterium]|nr:hypothetical protein [Bdellovibrionales bacterium]